ncbi:hypothetical protein YC2023_119442 [Brassica napus]
MEMVTLLSMLTQYIIRSQDMFILPSAAIASAVIQRVIVFLWAWDLSLGRNSTRPGMTIANASTPKSCGGPKKGRKNVSS